MGPQEPLSPHDGGGGAPTDGFDISGVALAERLELGGRSAFAARAFKAGERVFREQALVVAAAPTNLARLRAHLGLAAGSRREILERFWSEAPPVRCAATAACRTDSPTTGDSAAEVLATLRAEGHTEIELTEVEAVIRIWNLNAYDCALAPVACKVAHSCAPNVSVYVDAEARAIEARACCRIQEGEPLGSWYFQDTGLWWMGADVRRAIFETERGFLCACARCRGPDTCRAVPCDACGKGRLVPQGIAAMSTTPCSNGSPVWECSSCGRASGGDALRLAAEAEVVPRVLLELRPPRGAAGNVVRATPEELAALGASARERLGADHWAAAAALLVLHYRGRPAGGALGGFAVAAGCRFLGWLTSRSLPWPPASVGAPQRPSPTCTWAYWRGRPAAKRLESRDLLPVTSALESARPWRWPSIAPSGLLFLLPALLLLKPRPQTTAVSLRGYWWTSCCPCSMHLEPRWPTSPTQVPEWTGSALGWRSCARVAAIAGCRWQHSPLQARSAKWMPATSPPPRLCAASVSKCAIAVVHASSPIGRNGIELGALPCPSPLRGRFSGRR